VATLELKRELPRVSVIERNCEARCNTRTLFFHEDGVSRLFQVYPIDGYAEGAPLCLMNGKLTAWGCPPSACT